MQAVLTGQVVLAFLKETKECIGKTMDRGLQRQLRSKTRNKAFRKTVVDTRLRRPRLLCESDDIVVVYDSTEKRVFRWFVKMEDGELTARERNFLHNIQRWESQDRGLYAEAIIEATEDRVEVHRSNDSIPAWIIRCL